MNYDRSVDNFFRKNTRSEKLIQKEIVEWLQENLPGEKFIKKIHGNMYQSSLPDLLILWRGRSWWMEVKKIGKKATPLQLETILRIRKTNNHAFVVRGVEDVKQFILPHLEPSFECVSIDGERCPGLSKDGAL